MYLIPLSLLAKFQLNPTSRTVAYTCNKVGLVAGGAEVLPEESLGEGYEGHDGPVVAERHTAQHPEAPREPVYHMLECVQTKL